MTDKTVLASIFRARVKAAASQELIEVPYGLSAATARQIIAEEEELRREKEERLLTMAGVKQPEKAHVMGLPVGWPGVSDADPVNSPSHYNTGGIECFDAMSAMLTREEMIGYLRGNSFKYRWRFRRKGGAEDLRKAEWYEKKLLDLIENSA